LQSGPCVKLTSHFHLVTTSKSVETTYVFMARTGTTLLYTSTRIYVHIQQIVPTTYGCIPLYSEKGTVTQQVWNPRVLRNWILGDTEIQSISKSPLITYYCWRDSQLKCHISCITIAWYLTPCNLVDSTAYISVSQHEFSNRSCIPI